jgi:hypothetical protein
MWERDLAGAQAVKQRTTAGKHMHDKTATKMCKFLFVRAISNVQAF